MDAIMKINKQRTIINNMTQMSSRRPYTEDEVDGTPIIQFNIPGEVHVNIPIIREEMYAIMHELGHLADQNIECSDPHYCTTKTWRNEIRAWAYVYQFVHPDWHSEVTSLALRTLRMYANNIAEVRDITDQAIVQDIKNNRAKLSWCNTTG